MLPDADFARKMAAVPFFIVDKGGIKLKYSIAEELPNEFYLQGFEKLFK